MRFFFGEETLMADDKEGDENTKGNEWKVLALTESAYAAAPSPKQDYMDYSQSNLVGDSNAEIFHAMFMSGHFNFPICENENLPQESEYKEKCSGKGDINDVRGGMVHPGGKLDPEHEEYLSTKGLIPDEFSEASNIGEKGGGMLFYNSRLADAAASNLLEKEQIIYNNGKFDSYDDEATAGRPRSYMTEEGTGIDDPSESLDYATNSNLSNVRKHAEEEKYNEPPNLPSEAWWRKHSASVYSHAKNAKPFWSMFVASAVVGLVILGHQWQQDNKQVLQLKAQLVIDDKGGCFGPCLVLKMLLWVTIVVHTSHFSLCRIESLQLKMISPGLICVVIPLVYLKCNIAT